MTKIKSIFNNGNKQGAKTGLVNVNSFNVCPDTFLAAAVPVTITRGQMNQYDYFVITSGGATNEFDLPDAAAIGEVLTLYADSTFELRTETDSNDINNVTNTGYTATAGDVFTCYKVNATDWMVTKITILGAAVTIVAGVAA